MSLIVIPLASEEEEEAQLRASILEMMSLLYLDREARVLGSGGDTALPFVVPPEADRWELSNQGRPVQEHFILGSTAAAGTAGRLRHALSEALKDSALIRHRGDGQGAVPLILIVPVLVLPDTGGAASSGASPEEALQTVYNHLDEAAELMLSGGLGRTRLASASFRVMPWIFSSRPIEKLPGAFFIGPKKLGIQDITPVLYSAQADSGHQRPWLGYGQARLVTDLLALHTLSGDADVFKKHFRRFEGIDSRRGYYMHSGLFEYPLNDLVRENVLNQLSSDPEARQERLLLPTPERLGIDEDKLGEEIQEAVATCIEGIRQVIEKEEIQPESFHFDSRQHPTEERIAGPVDFGRIILTQSRVSQMSTRRYADLVHDDFYAELQRCTAVGLDRQLREALDSAHEGVTAAAKELEGALQSAFGTANQGSGGNEPTDRAARKAVGMIDRVTAGLKQLEQDLENRAPERPEEVLAHARKVRQSWLDREEELLKPAGSLPLLRGMVQEAVAVALGVLALLLMFLLPLDFSVWQGWFWVVTIPLVTLGAGFGIFRYRLRRWERYVEQWEELSAEMLAEANHFGDRLAGLLNQRIRLIKYSATGDLKRSLRAARERFITELAGFQKLVEEEVAERKLQRTRRARQDERFPPQDVGRFRVQIEDSALSVKVDGNDLYARLATILRGALTLTEMPRRATLDEHLAILRRQAELAVNAASFSVRDFAELAEELLTRTAQYGFDETQLSASGEHIRESSDAHLLLVGQSLQERLETRGLLGAQYAEAVWIPSAVLPSEVAIALTIRTLDSAEAAR